MGRLAVDLVAPRDVTNVLLLFVVFVPETKHTESVFELLICIYVMQIT